MPDVPDCLSTAVRVRGVDPRGGRVWGKHRDHHRHGMRPGWSIKGRAGTGRRGVTPALRADSARGPSSDPQSASSWSASRCFRSSSCPTWRKDFGSSCPRRCPARTPGWPEPSWARRRASRSGRRSKATWRTDCPKDELLVYEEALRRGRSIVIALVDSEDRAGVCRHIMARAGAESVDAARASWRIGLTGEPETDRSAA